MTNTNYPSGTFHSQTPATKKGNTKNIIIGVLAAGLLGTWGYVLFDKNKSEKKITEQQAQISSLDSSKATIQLEFDNALARLDSITGSNNNLQGLLADKQKEIDAKKAEIRKILNDKKASESQLAKARKMISELNDKITGLETEINRLKDENQTLTLANTTLKQEKEVMAKNLQTKAVENEELTKIIDMGSTFTASNIQVIPVDERKSGKEKNTTKAKRVDKLLVSFDVENRIAKSGPADIYLIVTAPDGKVITDASMGSGMLNTRTDGDKPFTTRVALDYTQGQRKNIQYPIRNQDFSTGEYKVEIYHNGFKIGEGTSSLKKGGLFG